ncbi:hypothetical protein J2785_007321 [Burkholderia ambifaria]|nr:hypothetical protein [Burkholderia ambifaria]
MQPSMGTAGDCYDNAMCESFFGTLESELLMRERFDTHEQARGRLFWFLEGWYNLRRLHSSIGYCSPLEFEDEHAKNKIMSSCELSTAGRRRGRDMATRRPPVDNPRLSAQWRLNRTSIATANLSVEAG